MTFASESVISYMATVHLNWLHKLVFRHNLRKMSSCWSREKTLFTSIFHARCSFLCGNCEAGNENITGKHKKEGKRTLEIVKAGLHCSFRMSRQMLPLLLILGWNTFVLNATYENQTKIYVERCLLQSRQTFKAGTKCRYM